MMKIGEYEARTQKKGYNEAFIEGIEEGDTYYVVQLGEYTKIDVKTQVEALLIAKVVRIEERIKRIEQRQIEQLKDKLGVE